MQIGQWCVYPNFDEMPEIHRASQTAQLRDLPQPSASKSYGQSGARFPYASGRLQTLCYKEDIESALRTPGMGGFQLLDLHDFPGQGTALVGVLDPFWESKGYVEPKEFRRVCGETVPLARLERRVFADRDTLVADVEVAHLGARPLAGATATWQLVADTGRVVESGVFPTRDVPIGNGIALGRIEVDLKPSHARALSTRRLRQSERERLGYLGLSQ